MHAKNESMAVKQKFCPEPGTIPWPFGRTHLINPWVMDSYFCNILLKEDLVRQVLEEMKVLFEQNQKEV